MPNLKYIPGDLVKVDNKVYQIECAIQRSKAHQNLTKLDRFVKIIKDIIYEVKEDSIKPIPLSDQILKDNGWKSEPFGVIYINKYKKEDVDIFIYRTEDNIWRCMIGNYAYPIKYVHQLQHLLFALGFDYNLKI